MRTIPRNRPGAFRRVERRREIAAGYLEKLLENFQSFVDADAEMETLPVHRRPTGDSPR